MGTFKVLLYVVAKDHSPTHEQKFSDHFSLSAITFD